MCGCVCEGEGWRLQLGGYRVSGKTENLEFADLESRVVLCLCEERCKCDVCMCVYVCVCVYVCECVCVCSKSNLVCF